MLINFSDKELSIIRELAFAQIQRNRISEKSDRGEESNPLFQIMWRREAAQVQGVLYPEEK